MQLESEAKGGEFKEYDGEPWRYTWSVRESITELVSPLFVHVSDCEDLTIYMEEMPAETLERIEKSRKKAFREDVPAPGVRRHHTESPGEYVETF